MVLCIVFLGYPKGRTNLIKCNFPCRFSSSLSTGSSELSTPKTLGADRIKLIWDLAWRAPNSSCVWGSDANRTSDNSAKVVSHSLCEVGVHIVEVHQNLRQRAKRGKHNETGQAPNMWNWADQTKLSKLGWRRTSQRNVITNAVHVVVGHSYCLIVSSSVANTFNNHLFIYLRVVIISNWVKTTYSLFTYILLPTQAWWNKVRSFENEGLETRSNSLAQRTCFGRHCDYSYFQRYFLVNTND